MSRHAAVALAVSACVMPGTALAQDAGADAQARAEALIDTSRIIFAPQPERKKPKPCPESVPGEIVVCARMQEDDTMRVPHEYDGTADVVPRAPDFDGGPNPNALARGCFIPPCPPEPALVVDTTQFPEPVDFPVGRAD